MSASQACEGRRPCPRRRRRRRSRPGRRRGASGPAGRTGEPAAPSLAVSRAEASGRPGGRAVRLPCARHLRTAPCVTVSAGDSLEGGHSLQPLHTSLLRRASQNGGAHGAGGGRSPAPFCARREICQRGIPPPRMQLTAKPAGGSRARGDHVTQEVDCAPHPHPRLRVLSVFSKGSLRGRGGDGGGRQRLLRGPAAG